MECSPVTPGDAAFLLPPYVPDHCASDDNNDDVEDAMDVDHDEPVPREYAVPAGFFSHNAAIDGDEEMPPMRDLSVERNLFQEVPPVEPFDSDAVEPVTMPLGDDAQARADADFLYFIEQGTNSLPRANEIASFANPFDPTMPLSRAYEEVAVPAPSYYLHEVVPYVSTFNF